MIKELRAIEDRKRATKQLKSKKKHFKEKELREFEFYESHIDHDDEDAVWHRIKNNASFLYQEMVEQPKIDSSMYVISGLEGIKAPGSSDATSMAVRGLMKNNSSMIMGGVPYQGGSTIHLASIDDDRNSMLE